MTCRRLEVFLIIGMAGALSVAAQVPTISVKTEEVRVDVLVTANNKPVHGLSAADFEVFDNGVRQKVHFAIQEHTPFNAVLVLDISESVAGERLFHLKSAGRMFLDELRKEERAALVTFSQAVSLDAELTDNVSHVKAQLGNVQSFGNTSLLDASYAGLMVAESRSGRPLLILFSDGLDTSSWLTHDAVLQTAKHSDVVVYAVSAGQHPKMTFLNDLTQFTGGALFKVESTRDLGAVFLNILEEFRQRYLLTYSPSGALSAGWHQLEVRVKRRSLKIKARPGYFVSPQISKTG
jgi:Ca-activated chloride channel family protein